MPKTLAIRLDDSLHAQAALMAQLLDISLTELIRSSIERYVEERKADPDLAAKAGAIRAQIEAEAATRQAAIETLFTAEEEDDKDPAGTEPTAIKRPSRSRAKTPDAS